LQSYFESGRPQKIKRPWLLSVALEDTFLGSDTIELRRLTGLLRSWLPTLHPGVGIELNASCVNMPRHLAADEVFDLVDALAPLRRPLAVKLNVTTPVAIVRGVAAHPAVDALVVSNTVQYGTPGFDAPGPFLGARIEEGSPLRRYGGGGISGAALFPHVLAWMRRHAHALGKPVIAGGGVLKAVDARRLIEAGAAGVFVGTAAIVRFWRVRGITEAAEAAFRRACREHYVAAPAFSGR
jgi:dihydroorotate dehydrogenase